MMLPPRTRQAGDELPEDKTQPEPRTVMDTPPVNGTLLGMTEDARGRSELTATDSEPTSL